MKHLALKLVILHIQRNLIYICFQYVQNVSNQAFFSIISSPYNIPNFYLCLGIVYKSGHY